MSCEITECKRKSEDSYCHIHKIAQIQLDNAYTSWKKAFGKKLSKKSFLSTIVNDEDLDVGLFAREVAAHLMKSQ
ncbi:MAG: hypothetical protein ACXAB7_22540 [Candidatus Kariarchaeaceae archaeon]|jgi:hypothetical protein